jgi:hypothetical protein
MLYHRGDVKMMERGHYKLYPRGDVKKKEGEALYAISPRRIKEEGAGRTSSYTTEVT